MPEQRSFGFYAYDKGPSNMIALVAQEAQKRAHHVVHIPPQVKSGALEYVEAASECDAILIGLSSFQTQEETDFVNAVWKRQREKMERWIGHDIGDNEWPDHFTRAKVVVMEDVPGTCLRPLAKDLTSQVYAAIVAAPFAAEDALNFGYKMVRYEGPIPTQEDTHTAAKVVRFLEEITR